VNPELEYSVIRRHSENAVPMIVASDLLESLKDIVGSVRIVGKIKGECFHYSAN
jgi:hypothetical protein